MVGTRQGTNTSCKVKKSVKKFKKLSKEDKHVTNMHGMKMNDVLIGGKTDGQAGGPPPSNNQRS